VAPKVLAYHSNDEETASLLVEFLPGETLQQIILNAERDHSRKALTALKKLLVDGVWPTTRRQAAIETSYMAQVLGRLDSIQNVHTFLRKQKFLGDVAVDSTATLVEKCLEIERLLPAPFSVFIHGDFNANNILYNVESDTAHFVDVNRSTQADYLQDVSVFLISAFRLPVFDSPAREEIDWITKEFFSFVKAFADQENDTTFDARLTLGLARSFFTSTRFQLNSDFVKEMVLRANFLMEKLIAFHQDDGDWQKFNLPEAVIHL
jgi:hypothetical protein